MRLVWDHLFVKVDHPGLGGTGVVYNGHGGSHPAFAYAPRVPRRTRGVVGLMAHHRQEPLPGRRARRSFAARGPLGVPGGRILLA
eukprot:10280323-Alexandrium_andersonii.AAC.1